MSAAEDYLPPTPGRSWRDIRQEVSAPAMSRRGRRRQVFSWLKIGGLATLIATAAWGVYVVVHEWETDRTALTTAVHSDPVRNIVLISDGVLTKEWASGMLALPKSATLMSLELPGLRDKLLVNGQVRVAVLTRSFPDTLVVTLQERSPVARVQASDGSGAPKQLFVARDGVVYDGLNYDKQMLAGLPWLDGIRLVRSGNGFEAIAGMEDVSTLLSTAQLQAPHLYREWLIVSLARLAERDEIVVKTQNIPEIIFSRKRDYFKQIAQLDYVIDRALLLPEPGLKSVNLSLEGQVPVQLTNPPSELASAPQPGFSLQPSAQRKVKRDL
jgi:cell division protein FtsQ